MKRVIVLSGLFVIATTLCAPSHAQDKKKDDGGPSKVVLGPEHKVLATLAGTFDAEVKMFLDPTKPTVTKGTMTRKMIHGGTFMQENFSGEFFNMKFTGSAVVGYDQVKKKFTTAWCDSMSTSMMLMEGTYDPEKKTLTSIGDDVEASGKKMKARDVLTIKSADSQFFQMFRMPQGEKQEFKVMEVTYTRAKT